jgi:hypothetical protein
MVIYEAETNGLAAGISLKVRSLVTRSWFVPNKRFSRPPCSQKPPPSHEPPQVASFPPNLQPFAFLLDTQSPEVQGAFQFLLATAMHEGGNPRFGKFELLNVTEVDG